MPRTTELKAEEGVTHSPLRRSSRIIAVSSPIPQESKLTRGRRLSTSSENNGSDDKNETKPSRAKRATSVTKEDTDPKAETAKPRTRRSSVSAEPTVPEEKKQPVTRRRSSVTEEASKTTVAPTKGRRNSVTAKDVEDADKAPSSDKGAGDSKTKPITRRRSMSQEISEEIEETKPLTRSRRRSVDRDEVEISERKTTRQRRSSTENLEDSEPKTAKLTPVKNKRRPSITDNAIILEPIEELEGERKSISPVKDKSLQINLTPVKRKHEPSKADLDLSIIDECSFTEGNHSHTEAASSASENPRGVSEEKRASETVTEKGEYEFEKNSTASTGKTISESAGTSISESALAGTTSTKSIPAESSPAKPSSAKSSPAKPTSVESISSELTPESITESAKTPPKELTSERKSITPKKSPRFRSSTESESVISILGTENEDVTQKSSLSPNHHDCSMKDPSDDSLNKSKTNEHIKLSNSSPVSVEKITPEPKISPRKSPRIQAKMENNSKGSEKKLENVESENKVDNAEKTQNLVEKSQPSCVDEELSKTLLKDEQILKDLDSEHSAPNQRTLDDSVFDSKVPALGEDSTKHTTNFISSGSDGSFRFNLSDIIKVNSEDELNSSKISNSSDKENIAVNSDDDMSGTKVPLTDKRVLEESTVIREKTESNQAVIVSRVSNVFRPKNINFSFAEPMDVDKTTIDLESSTFEISDSKLQNDENVKLNVSIPLVNSSEVSDSPRGVAGVVKNIDANSAELTSFPVAAEDSDIDTSNAFCETLPVESKDVSNICVPEQPILVMVEENEEQGVKNPTTTLKESVSNYTDQNLPEIARDPSSNIVIEKSASSPDYDFHLPSDDEIETITLPQNSSEISEHPDIPESKEATSNNKVEEDKFVEVNAETSPEVSDHPDMGVEEDKFVVEAGSNSEVSDHPIDEMEEISPNQGIEEGKCVVVNAETSHPDKGVEEDNFVVEAGSKVSDHPVNEMEGKCASVVNALTSPEISDHPDIVESKEMSSNKEIEEAPLVGLNTSKEINDSPSELADQSSFEVKSDEEKEQIESEDITEMPKKCESTSEVENESDVETSTRYITEDSKKEKEDEADIVENIDMADEEIEIIEEKHSGTANSSIVEKTEMIEENSSLKSIPDIEEHTTESNDKQFYVDIEDEEKNEKRENDISNGENATTVPVLSDIENVKISGVQEVQSESNSLENLKTEPVDIGHTLKDEIFSKEKTMENNSDSPVASSETITNEVKEDNIVDGENDSDSPVASSETITNEVKEDKIVDGENEINLIKSETNEDNVENSKTVSNVCINDDYDEMERSFQDIRNDEDDVLVEDKSRNESPIPISSDSTEDSKESKISRKLRKDKSVVNEELPEQPEKPKENEKDEVVDVEDISRETLTSDRNSSETPKKKKNKRKKKRSIEPVADDTTEELVVISDQNTQDDVEKDSKKELVDQSAFESKERKNKKKKKKIDSTACDFEKSIRKDTCNIETETTGDDSTKSKKIKKKRPSTLADDSISSASKAKEPKSDNLDDSKFSKKNKKKKISECENESISNEMIENVEETGEAASTDILDEMKIEKIDQTKESTKKKSKLQRSRDTTDNILEGDPKSKLHEFLENAISKSERHSSEEDESEVEYASEEEDVYASNPYIDSMAEEGEEDTPSDDSNDIIDEGESINSTESERDTDDDYDDDDSFICDDEVVELLSGSEYDFEDEINTKSKKSRIINVEECNSDIIKIDRKEKQKKPKRRSRIISVSSEDEQDNRPEDVVQSLEDELVIKLKDEEPKKRKSSITILENIDVKDIKDAVLSDRVHTIVDRICTFLPREADISMNLSLEYGDSDGLSSKQSAESRKENKSPGCEQRLSLEASDLKTKLTKDAKRSSTSNDGCAVRRKKPRLSVSLDDVGDLNETGGKLNTRKRRSTEELNIKKSKKKKKSKDSQTTDTEGPEDDLRAASFSLLNQLLTDPKNRPRRTVKPSTSKGFSGGPWIIDRANVKPSTSIVSQREIEDYKTNKIHPKDFRNQRLYGKSSRVKRIDTKKLLMKRGFYE